MKLKLLTFFCSLNLMLWGQITKNDLKDCNIFCTGSYINNVNNYKSIYTRDFIKDTILYNRKFKKYKKSEFVEYPKFINEHYYFEFFDNGEYIKLDHHQNIIHWVEYNTPNQIGFIFGQKEPINFEFVHDNNSFPKDTIPTNKTPKKFHNIKEPDNYFALLPDLRVNQLEYRNNMYSKQLINEIIYKISKNYNSLKTINNQFNNTLGDEVELIYRRKWYNEDTEKAEYEDKQIINCKYLKDTIIDNQKVIVLESTNFNFSSGTEENTIYSNVVVTDTAFIFNTHQIPINDYTTEMKILDNNSIFLQSVIEEKIGKSSLPIVRQYYSDDYYNPVILGYFPMMFVEVGIIEGYITYAKINGIEYGNKKERIYPNDKTHIRKIRQISKDEIEILFYTNKSNQIEVKFGQNNNLIKLLNKKFKPGIHSLKLKTGQLNPDKIYDLLLEYKHTNSSGTILKTLQPKVNFNN